MRRRSGGPAARAPRSFTLREHSGIDSLAARDSRAAAERDRRRELDPNEAPSSVRWNRRRPVLGSPEIAPFLAPSSTTGAAASFEGVASPGRKGLGRDTALMAGGTLLSRVTGLLRLLVAAYALGYNRLSDAFNLANNTPNIVHDLVLGGILSATFVPLFVDRLTRRSRQEASESISAVVTLASIVLVVATVLFVVLAPFIIDLYSAGTTSGHIALERSVATELLRLFAIQLLGYGAISLMTAILNTARRFALPAYVPVLNNLIAMAVLVEFHLADSHPSVTGISHNSGLILLLGIGTSAGVVVQALFLVPATVRAGIPIRFRFEPRNEAVREILSLSSWTFGFVLTNQIALFVTLALAVHVMSGAVTAYTYAFTFFQLQFGMVAVSVMSTVTPELAQRYSSGDLAGMAHHFGLGLRRMMAGIWPATAGYLVLAGPIMALLLRHGAAGHTAGPSLTGSLLALFALGLPGYCVYLLCITALQACRDTRPAFFLYLLENGLNVVLVFVLTSFLGPKGLSLSITIAYSLAAVVALVVVRQKMGALGDKGTGRYVARSFTLALLMGLVVSVVSVGVGSPSGVGLGFRVVISLLVGIGVYVGGAALAGSLKRWQTAGVGQHASGKGT